jgi:hypothetical protein
MPLKIHPNSLIPKQVCVEIREEFHADLRKMVRVPDRVTQEVQRIHDAARKRVLLRHYPENSNVE